MASRFARMLGRSLVLASMLGVVPARADLWTFIDEQGVLHFASEQVDPRYQLFFRSSVAPTQPAFAGVAENVVPGVAEVEFQRRRDWLERLPQYRQVQTYLHEASARHNIDPHLLTALVATESGFRSDAVSPKGALGLMQVMPDTADRYGVSGATRAAQMTRLFDPVQNLRAGTRYLRDLLNLFEGSLELALAAYNAGEGAVQRAGNRIPAYRETQNYVRTVLQLYAALRPPERPTTATAVPVRPAPSPAPIVGGAIGRGNMVPPHALLPRVPAPTPDHMASDDERTR